MDKEVEGPACLIWLQKSRPGFATSLLAPHLGSIPWTFCKGTPLPLSFIPGDCTSSSWPDPEHPSSLRRSPPARKPHRDCPWWSQPQSCPQMWQRAQWSGRHQWHWAPPRMCFQRRQGGCWGSVSGRTWSVAPPAVAEKLWWKCEFIPGLLKSKRGEWWRVDTVLRRGWGACWEISFRIPLGLLNLIKN